MKEVCGFKDMNGRFWDTKEEAELADKKIDEFYEKEAIIKSFNDKFKTDGGFIIHTFGDANRQNYSQMRMSIEDFIWKYPDELFDVVVKVIKYNFKRRMNDDSNRL